MNVLVVSPHPDDEAIGMGGAIAWHVEHGDRVEVLFVTGGERGVPADMASTLEDARIIRHREAGEASYCTGSHQLHMLTLVDGEVPHNDTRLALSITTRIKESEIERVYGPTDLDSHPDHRAVSQAILMARQDVEFDWLTYEIWTPHISPNVIVDITPFATRKRAAIRSYKSQLANAFEDAILSLNHYRGILFSGGSGVMYAEAFRRIVA